MKWQDIPGWSCPVLLAYYDELAKALKPGQIHVEVGVAYGRSLAYFAGRSDNGVQIIGVDSWLVKMGRGTPDVWRKVSHFPTAWDAVKAMLEEPMFDRIELCRGNSVDVAYALDFEVDSVFLDGSHEYEAVKRDIEAWRARVKPGGVLAGHDINDHYPGVGRAVRELLPGVEVRPAVEEGGWGGVWVWRK